MANETIFGVLRNAAATRKALSSIPTHHSGWRRILEPFTGAWQKNISEDQQTLLSYPTLYACIMRIATDGGKLPFKLRRFVEGIWEDDTSNTAYWPVLRKPNSYQTGQQFRESWLLSKLIQGNTYVLKRRDNRGVVNGLYVLDPCRVQPMVSESGKVYYQLQTDRLSDLPENYPAADLLVPAYDIIHDRCVTLHHWLIGVPPLSAAYWPALKNLKILKSAAEFFGNNANPGGILTAPAGMSEADAADVKAYWDSNYNGENSGKIAVIGADMKFTAFSMKGADSQLVEQMQYSDRQICQPFGIPPYIVGVGEIPAGLKVDDVTNTYFSLALQSHIEAMEYLLDEGLGVSFPLGIEVDLEPLLRMDTEKRANVMGKLVNDGVATPNEARREFGFRPLEGGDTVYMQQQDFPLDQVRQNKIVNSQDEPAESMSDEEMDEQLGAESMEDLA